METIELIKGDSSSIFEFSNKQVPTLGDDWEGGWFVSEALGTKPILEGSLMKNSPIFNNDSLVGEEFRKTFKIFEGSETEKVQWNEDIIDEESAIISGIVHIDNIPQPNRYITVQLKGIFSSFTRDIRIKTDEEGKFSYDFNIGNTVKTPENSFFLFQLMPLESELLEVKTYMISIEIRQLDNESKLQFRKVVMQAKLKITAK